MVYKIIKYIFLALLLLSVSIISYFIFESLTTKRGINYQNLEEIPRVSWLNIRSGIFSLVMKATHNKTLLSYDDTKYITVIIPKEKEFNLYPEVSLYYLANGVKYGEDVDIKLYKYPAVFRTRFKNNDYLLFLQENIQKDEKTGLLIATYPVNLIRNKTVGEFISIIANQPLFAPTISTMYKFDSIETCNQKFNDKSYCKWLLSNQRRIFKLVKKWSDTGIVPLGMMRYPLIFNLARI